MENSTNRVKQPLCVLIAEDDPVNAESLAMVLRLEGYTVHLAPDGVLAVEAAELHHPDVVLLDIGMPRLDGYEVAKLLQQKRKPKRPLLIAVTGYGLRAERLRAYEAGIDFHLTKPVEPEELLGLLARYQATIVPNGDQHDSAG